MKILGIIIRDDRGKNFQTLLDLEITKDERNKILMDLKVEDYSDGPIKDNLLNKADMWVFGKVVKGREIYIKITMGVFGSSVICISFHISEYPIKYPLKIKGK